MQINSQFTLFEELYSSASTRIWRAAAVADGRPVVLKILSEDEAQHQPHYAQFQREFQIMRTLLEVEGVNRAYALENVNDALMIVSEDIGGRSLAQVLEGGPLAPATGLPLAVRLAGMLAGVHAQGVIHKDLTPANIVWNRATGALRLIDFGIASQLNQERSGFQSVHELEGTLHYVSPEQTGRVNRGMDSRSDLYTLGVTLYHLFTGVLPFAGRQGIELVHAHIALAPKPPHLCNPAVPPLLSDIIMRLMAKNADDRYQSAAGLAHDLRLCAEAVLDAGGPAAGAVGFTLGAHDALGNFRIPGKLYGREREIEAIVAAFERAASGPAELLLVGGFAGSGKTALVHEVHQPLTQRHGGYIEGKFDQYQRDVPFYAWRMAFEGFCQLLLKEDEASLARWRERILGAVDGQGKVLAEVIPSIELVIGPQPGVIALSGSQALNRLHYVFGAFLQAVCSAKHPLAVFIDDWQWADAGSLSLLEAVMAQPRLQSLLLICAYRDNETPAAHPFAQALARLRAAQVPLDAIDVQALALDDVRQMVSDTLAGSPGSSSVDALARLLFDRTHGNAFFLRQLLTELHGSGALRYDLAQRRWHWRDEDIAALAIADNVVSLMAAKIARLPGPVRQALLYASCIGDRFELATLAALLGQPPHEVAAELEQALQASIVAPVGMNYRTARQQGHTDGVHYRFIHDRVRQAAYGMLGEDTRARLHHLIARQWLGRWDENQRRQRIFDIANQFNAGRALVQDAGQRSELAEVNLEAGKRARAAAAYSSAQAYFRLAIESGPTAIWEQQPALAMELYLAAAETAFLAKDYPAMDQWAAEFLARRTAPLERVQALKIQVQACVAQNRLSDAVDVALHALDLLGVPLQRTPHPLRVMGQVMATKLALRNRPISQLQQLPAMEDPAMLAVMDLLGLILPPAYWISEGLLALVVCKMVSVSLAHGYSPNAGYGFAWWGITECAMLGNIETGVAYGEFANDLARRHNLNLQQPLFFAAWIIHKFRHPLRTTIPMFEETYALSLQKGDFEYASYARNNHMQTLFHTGCPLPELLERMEQAHADLQRFQVGSSLYWHAIWWQAARNFATPGDAPTVLNGDAYRESELLPQHQKANDASTLFLLYSAKLMLAIHFNDGAHALSHARSARQFLKAGVGMHAFVLFHFHESLALLLHGDARGWAARRRVLRVVDGNQAKLKLWAQHAPDNYRYHWLLCEALRLRLQGRLEQAHQVLDQAIDCARAQGQLHEEALASELAARTFLAQQRERLAGHYLRQALLMYERWGAEAKVQQLSGEFAGLLATSTLHGDHTLPAGGRTVTLRTSRTLATGAMAQHAFDMQAVTSASQAISKEIRIADMVRTLLTIVVEHSGAQRALLMLRQGESWRVVASADAGASNGIEVGTCDVQLDTDAQGLLPVSLAQYVRRTMRPQVLQDARQQSIFSGDPYLQRARPRSVLCEPIAHQGSLLGILYLENTLTVGAFPEERLELLRVLAAQAAISLENARLYADMEARVRARTRELAESLETVRVTGEQVAALLDNAGQGFLSFGADMAVAPQYSRACETMLGQAPAGRHAGVLLFPADPHNADLLADATKRVLGTDDPDRREVMLSLLPSEWTRAGRQLSATYAVLNTGRLMVTLTDVTEERRLAEQVAAEHGRLKMVHAAVAESTEFLDSVAAFRQFVRDELPQMLAAPQPPQAVLERVYREVHTYKGVLGQFCFQHAPQVLHVAESGLEDLKELGDALTLQELADYLASLGLEQAVAGDLAALESVLGPAFLAGGKRLSVTDQQARQMETLVMRLLRGEPVEMAEAGKRELLKIGNLHKVAVRDALSGHDRTMAAVAARLRKLLAPVRFIDSETVWLDPAACRPFLRSLAHVFRNAVAHGIEAPQQRRAAGKPDAGQITCTIVRSDGWLTLDIADDGAGIDTAALRRKARERGLHGDAELDAMDEARMQELVFADGLSTAARADQFSGRGVGLAAVRAETLKLGGTVSVRSVQGQGTRFTFRLPLAALAATVESEVL